MSCAFLSQDVLEPEELDNLLPDHVHKPNLVLSILSGDNC